MNLRKIYKRINDAKKDNLNELFDMVVYSNNDLAEYEVKKLFEDEIVILQDQMQNYPYLYEKDLDDACSKLKIENSEENKSLLYDVIGASKIKENGKSYDDFISKSKKRKLELLEKEEEEGELSSKEEEELNKLNEGSSTRDMSSSFKTTAKRNENTSYDSKTNSYTKENSKKNTKQNTKQSSKDNNASEGSEKKDGFLKRLGKKVISEMEDYNRKNEWYFPSDIKQYHFLETKK